MVRRFLNITGLVVIVAACLGTVAAASSKGEAWLCDMKTVDSTGWLSRRIEFHVYADGQAKVFDSAISEVFGQPIPAEVAEDAGVRLKLKWIVHNLRVDAGTTVSRPLYSAFLNRSTKRVTVSAFIALVDMPLVGMGHCVPKTPQAAFSSTSAPRRRIVVEVPEW